MSIKSTTFQAILGNPQNTHNFIVRIPMLDSDISLLVSATTFPTEQARTMELWFQGERIPFPTLPESAQEWSCTVPESESVRTFRDLVRSRGMMYNQKVGTHVPAVKQPIEVVARTMNDAESFKVILHGGFFKGFEPVPLSNSDPTANWEWELNFGFGWIEDVII